MRTSDERISLPLTHPPYAECMEGPAVNRGFRASSIMNKSTVPGMAGKPPPTRRNQPTVAQTRAALGTTTAQFLDAYMGERASEICKYFVPDFSNWKTDDSYRAQPFVAYRAKSNSHWSRLAGWFLSYMQMIPGELFRPKTQDRDRAIQNLVSTWLIREIEATVGTFFVGYEAVSSRLRP
jgi:hypothetical protein